MKTFDSILKPLTERLKGSEHTELIQLVTATITDYTKASKLAKYILQNETSLYLFDIYLNKDEVVDNEIGIYINNYGYIFDNATAYVFNSAEIDAVRVNDNTTAYAFNESEIIALRKSKIYAYNYSYIVAHHDSYIDITDKCVADIYNNVRYKAAGESIIIMESKDSNKGISFDQATITYNPSEIKELLTSRNYTLQ